MRQRLQWVPPVGSDDGIGHKRMLLPPLDETSRPSRLWSLYAHTDETSPPSLPFEPVHQVNAFLEDFVHDWNVHRGQVRYYSRVSDGGLWILLEWED